MTTVAPGLNPLLGFAHTRGELPIATTDWSVVLVAGAGGSTEARQAMGTLFQTYWPAVYAFIRRRGYSASDAEDLAQAYFTRFFEKRYARDFRPSAGRFRTFLRVTLAHFLANEWDRQHALKRGGGKPLVSLDATAAEERYLREPADHVTPETLFERHWAAAMLERCLARLRQNQKGLEGGSRFERLRAFLVGGDAFSGYAGAAHELGLSEAAVRVAVYRLRRRFCSVLREEVARTVTDPNEIDAEIRWLLGAVRGTG